MIEFSSDKVRAAFEKIAFKKTKKGMTNLEAVAEICFANAKKGSAVHMKIALEILQEQKDARIIGAYIIAIAAKNRVNPFADARLAAILEIGGYRKADLLTAREENNSGEGGD